MKPTHNQTELPKLPHPEGKITKNACTRFPESAKTKTYGVELETRKIVLRKYITYVDKGILKFKGGF